MNKTANTTIILLQVHWQIVSDSDTAADFLAIVGSVIIVEGQREAEIILSLMPDTVPELEELYIVQLTAVDGGGTLDANPDLIKTQIRCDSRTMLESLLYHALDILTIEYNDINN